MASSYPVREDYKPPDRLTPEEFEVQTALKDYTDNPAEADPIRDFTPTDALYQTYLRHRASFPKRFPDDPQQLNRVQFGIALRRIFPNLADAEDAGDGGRSRRRINGKQVWGLMGVKGPETLRVATRPGRPTNQTRL